MSKFEDLDKSFWAALFSFLVTLTWLGPSLISSPSTIAVLLGFGCLIGSAAWLWNHSGKASSEFGKFVSLFK